jgi:hypothetical protein
MSWHLSSSNFIVGWALPTQGISDFHIGNLSPSKQLSSSNFLALIIQQLGCKVGNAHPTGFLIFILEIYRHQSN